MELPQCNIDPEASLLQTVRVISRRARELEDKAKMMDVEYKARIVELEAREPTTPLEKHEVRIKELKVASNMIALHLEGTQEILDDATLTWTTMEEILDLVTIHREV